MKKKLAWWLWLPLSAVSPLALAVGLGQATVNSPLQSPLDATVPLVDAAGVALDDVRVEIANEAAFNALGLEWTPLVASVREQFDAAPDEDVEHDVMEFLNRLVDKGLVRVVG